MYRGYNRDALTIMKDAGAHATSQAAQVGGAPRILTLGDARWEAVIVIDCTAIVTNDADETYEVVFQISDVAAMSSAVIDFARMPITVVGRHEFPVCNVKAGVKYTYARLYSNVGGTTPTFSFTAFAAPLSWS